ncbi:MAG: glycosyltransferase family 39 protein, partial [Candidatus Harrisonbacteria bacterium]|nr:glycosyltransferase family 39 protein [Candidatus Harrisonbacteria bacterium]
MTVERRTLIILLIIVALGAALRLWNLGTAELTFDEGLYAFRSVGYLDYLENPAQPTPIQWFAGKALPWWTRLSFHDHPPLVFLVQHAATLLLGDTLFAARLPSAFAGIALIILLFFITRRLFNAPYADKFALG